MDRHKKTGMQKDLYTGIMSILVYHNAAAYARAAAFRVCVK